MLWFKKKYQYRPLSRDSPQIRLLRLRPELDKDGLIQFDISTYDLATAPEYQALSYEWGSPKRLRRVSMANQIAKVRCNLWLFLNMFRSSSMNNTLLWIDQVCIDQENASERGDQVKLMGEIYMNAVRGVVWLGPSTGVNTDLQTTFERHGHPLRSGITSSDLCTDDQCAWCCERTKEFFIRTNPTGHVPRARVERLLLKDITELTYWTRLWIIQENMLARDCVFFVGDLQYSRLEIRHYMKLLWPRKDTSGFNVNVVHISRLAGNQEAGRNLRLEEVFMHYDICYLKYTDSRDLVYGFLGLVQPGHGVTVDYQSTSMDVFGHLMGKIILSPSLKESRAKDTGRWLSVNLAEMGNTLGLILPWEGWLGVAGSLGTFDSPIQKFLDCLCSLENLGFHKMRWTSYELGAIIHTAQEIEHTLLPPSPVFLDSLDEGSMPSRTAQCIRFIEAINRITACDLERHLLDIANSTNAKDPTQTLLDWSELFAQTQRVGHRTQASKAIE